MKQNSEYIFKKRYIGIFSLNYLIQGLNHSMFVVVIPIYLLVTQGMINTATISFMISFIMIPFTLKFLFGALSDKIGTIKLGRRKLWILISSIISGSLWLSLPLIISSIQMNLALIFAIVGIFIVLGVSINDCAIDGFILDLCPRSKLGQTTGTCWAFREIGILMGAPLSLLIISFFPIYVLFISIGIFTIFFSLLALYVKEINTDVFHKIDLFNNFKNIVKKKENWKVFLFSFFMAIFGAIMYVFLSLFVLIKIGLVNPIGANIETQSDNINLYLLQAIITIFISIGVISGSIIGGRVADKKSRSFAVIFSFFLTSTSILLLVSPISSNGWYIVLIFATFVGIGMGWNATALTAIISEYSKKYPETNLTYLSICVSFTNLGGVISLFTIGIILNVLASQTSDIIIIYGIAFGSITLIYLLGSLLTFLLMDKKQFEYKFDGKD